MEGLVLRFVETISNVDVLCTLLTRPARSA
jgi:hypothetical protein